MNRITLAALILLTLAGCATPAVDPHTANDATYPHCDERAMRSAGMVKVDRCIRWTFGPSPSQIQRFNSSRQRLLTGAR